MRGTVKFWHEKGWGFITPTEGPERFVHVRELVDLAALEEGQQVEFMPADHERWPRAVVVRLIEENQEQGEK